MNSTLFNATLIARNATATEAPSVESSENQFSKLSMIGMFLALQLCQLTQPAGSLVLTNVTGSFWRCNPISSFVEGSVITYYLLKTTLATGWSDLGRLYRELQKTAAGLLLLRGANNRDDERDLMQKLLSGTFLDRADGETPAATSTSRDITDQAVQRTVSSSSRYSALEANRLPRATSTSLPAAGLVSEKSGILHDALGSNALAHREFQIDLFTGFTMVTFVIKLMAIRGDSWFTVAAVFLVFGWWTVQLLLLLLHWHDMNEIQMAAVVRNLKILNSELAEAESIWIIPVFVVLHLPFFGYPAYLVAFFDTSLSGEWQETVRQGMSIFAGIAMFAVVPTGLIAFLGGVIQLPKLWTWLFVVMCPVVCVWIFLSSYSYFYQTCDFLPERNTACHQNFTSIFTPGQVMYYAVDRSWDKVMKAIGALVLLVVISSIYFFTLMSDGSGKRTSFGNFCFVLVVFIIYVVNFDPSTTYKPSWIEILG